MVESREPEAPLVSRISTGGVPVADRAALLSDELGQRLTAGLAQPMREALVEPAIDWLNVDLGDGLVVADVRVSALDVSRSEAEARAGDDDCTLFVALSGGVRFEQNDSRVHLGRGDAVFVAHGRSVRSWYSCSERMLLVRLPRELVAAGIGVESAGGLRLAGEREEIELLRSYLATTVRRAEAGRLPSPLALRHIGELVVAAVSRTQGSDRMSTGGVAAARFERMLEHVATRSADPALSMDQVARSAGVSSRTGYGLFEVRGVSFADLLVETRLTRAREWLSRCPAPPPSILDIACGVGFKDLSHFNRRFRRRFGCTPSDVRRAAASGAVSP